VECISAPLSNKYVITSENPDTVAICIAVTPLSLLLLTSDPADSNLMTHSRCFSRTAKCNGVFPCRFVSLIFAPFSINKSRDSISPRAADICKAVSPSPSLWLTSEPLLSNNLVPSICCPIMDACNTVVP